MHADTDHARQAVMLQIQLLERLESADKTFAGDLEVANSPWCKSGDGRESEIELKTSNWYGDGQAAASRAARGFVGGAHAVGQRSRSSIL